MTDDTKNQNELGRELETGALLDHINQFLTNNLPSGEINRIDDEVAEVLMPEEYISYLRYKKYCMEHLASLNRTPGCNSALNASIERGFILGYWFGLTHLQEKAV